MKNRETALMLDMADSLSCLHNRAIYLCGISNSLKMNKEVVRLKKAATDIERQIDKIMTLIHSSTVVDVKKIRRKLELASKGVNAKITRMENGKEIAKNIVAATQFLDEAVKITTALTH